MKFGVDSRGESPVKDSKKSSKSPKKASKTPVTDEPTNRGEKRHIKPPVPKFGRKKRRKTKDGQSQGDDKEEDSSHEEEPQDQTTKPFNFPEAEEPEPVPLQQPTPEKQEALPSPEPLPEEAQKPSIPKVDKYTMQTPIEEIRALLIVDGLRQKQGNEVSV